MAIIARCHDLIADRVHRVEAGHRLLEDHGDLAAAKVQHLSFCHGQQVTALEEDRAAVDPARGPGYQLKHGHGRHGLAAAGLTDQSQGLAGVDGQAHAVDRLHPAAGHIEGDGEVGDLE
jgi:hypothetical protein